MVRAKLIRSALMALAFTIGSMDQHMETVAFWVALPVPYVCFWGKFTGVAELLRVFSMGLFGFLAHRDPRIGTYALAIAVWISLSFFDPLFETMETASEEVASSSSISTLAEKDFGVFLSFNRGPDIPDEFIDFLVDQLTRSGISVFGDGRKLPEGEQLIEVIKQSKISVPIISKGYASSESCLVELSLMLECRRTNGQMVIPIFYDPSDVRQVRGSFEMSLKGHEMKGTDGRTIDAWGRGLHEVGGLERFYSADKNYGYSSKLAKQLVLDVLQLLRNWDIGVKKNFVGIQDRVQEVLTKLGVYYRDGQSVGLRGGDVRVVGIYGTGGVGKTTLAKVVYKDMASLFDGCKLS